MRIMGIDPGLRITGYGLIDHRGNLSRLLEGGVIRPEADAALELRLARIHQGVREVLGEYAPEVLVVEEVYSKYAFPRAAIMIGHVRGVVYLAAAERAIPIVAYPASLVKRALAGHGRATKAQVAAMVCQRLALAQPPRPADVTDALALAICHTSALRMQTTAPETLPPALQAALGRQGGRRA